MKYHNVKVEYDGYKFDSKHERDTYMILKDRQCKGEISELRLQVPFILQDGYKLGNKKQQAITYIADFTYYEDKKFRVVDAKGILTDVYKIKKKLFEYKYQIEITEIY